MANEITGKLVLKVNKGGAKFNRAESFSYDMAGDSFTHSIVDVSDAGELLVQSADLVNGGYCFLKNLGSAVISLGHEADATDHKIRLQPGAIAFFEINGNTIYANTYQDTSLLEYFIIEL